MATMLIGTSQGLYAKSLDENTDSASQVAFADNHKYGDIRSPVVCDSEDSKRLYLGTTRSGIWRSDDGGTSWTEINDGLVHKEVWWLAQQAETGHLYAGTGPAGLYKSIDQGRHWEEFDNLWQVEGRADWHLHLPPYFPRMRNIAFAHNDPSVIVCAIEEGWLIRTSDGGNSWSASRHGLNPDVHTVTIMPDDPHIVLAATGDGLYRSTDSGITFARCAGIDKPYVTHVLSNPKAPKMVFAVASDNRPRYWRMDEGAGTGFFLSSDSGRWWCEITAGVPPYVHAGSYAATWDPIDEHIIHVGLGDGSVWRVDLDGSASQWQAGFPSVTALAISR
ncbi:MAG: hypothetical protein EPN30_04800 [Actinomycetota bacterium]|nr:MAG: hypothetical protein EPN30_04800 [Actinomycetota bacterium]